MCELSAISSFYSQIVLRRGLPFLLEVPNEITITAIEEARTGHDQKNSPSAAVSVGRIARAITRRLASRTDATVVA
jgi:hypothetical protein